jgi:glucose/arabinose dehydrogenase
LNRPVSLRAAPGDVNRLFVVEQRGRIRIIKRGVLLATPFLDLTHKVTFGTELGLLSIAFHPDYADNGIFYVYYLDTPPETGLRSLVSRFQVSADPDRADPATEHVILQQLQPWNVHKGGDLFFGLDRYLYVPFGDGGLSISQQDNGQRLDTWLGKILRIDVDGDDPYRIPPDNPFINVGGALGEIWAMGLRNPWRVSLDRTTGHLFIGDVGEQRWEEINVIPARGSGRNFGWPRVEGTVCTRSPCNPSQFAAPLIEYPHNDGACSIIGGFVYRGCSMPDLHRAYFHSDFCSGFVRSFVYDAGAATDRRDWTAMLQPAERLLNAVSSFGQDARGEIYICDLDGEVYQLVSANE